jgi:ABC-2 type transport system permease protein
LPSRSSAWTWLLQKEWRELMSSRSWWVMLALIGPLVGVSFISAVRSYAEASGQGGAAAGLADALFPLDGVVAPTFSAYEIAASFLLPFVAIRAIAGDRTSGALKLELQQGMMPVSMIGAKALVLGTGWLLAAVPIVLAGMLWVSYGGSLYAPEIGSLALGHMLNAGIVIALASAAASLAEHPSTAAILVLAFTVGTWVLSFVSAFQGGIWEEIAGYTPSEMLQAFRRGLVRLDLVLAAVVLIGAALVLAAVWMRLGVPMWRKATESVAIISVAAALAFAAAFVRLSWDVSENERNSFAASETAILGQITAPLKIEAHLAPEDPRRFDLEKQTFSKLRRTMPKVTMEYVSGSATGLFEQASEHYGEIWYDLGGKRLVGRAATTDGVLDAIYELAGIQRPQEGEAGHRGHPLAAHPNGAIPLFYVVWPLAVFSLGLFLHRRRLS